MTDTTEASRAAIRSAAAYHPDLVAARAKLLEAANAAERKHNAIACVIADALADGESVTSSFVESYRAAKADAEAAYKAWSDALLADTCAP